MAQVAFDTLQYVEKLRGVGFSEPQAKTMSEVQKEVISQVIETQLATKSDVADLRAELKSDIADLKFEIGKLEAVFNGKFSLLYWMFGFSLTLTLAILFKLILH